LQRSSKRRAEMLDYYTGGTALSVSVAAFVVTYLTTPPLASWLERRGIVGIDVHKLDRPNIPEMCGLSIIAGIAAGTLSLEMLNGLSLDTIAFLTTVLIAGGIGTVDDLRPLNPKLKPALTALAAVPILLLGTYNPHPVFPLIGAFRLTIVYPILIFFAIAVPANAVNMLDVFNGSMSGTLTIVSLTLAVVLAVSGKTTAMGLALALFGSLSAFYLFNRYPARVFDGDTGSLAAGAAVGALAVIGRIELVTIVALVPYIMNSFYGLASIGRLYERREIKPRPVILSSDGMLEATTERHAPVTLTRLILAEGPMLERQVVRIMQLLTVLSCAIAVMASLLLEVR
jgi:UDP-N-acetylmuramyl pentapeptide phosphotransferase/UDP-N-acetylglucosamine-1-phosphate transferase